MTATAPVVGHPSHVTDGPMIVVREARYVYPRGKVVALDGLTIDVPAGQIVGIAGQNGSGKTTLTKLLNGLLKPTSGSVTVNGMNTSDWPVQKMAAHVGYVFQNPNHQLFATSYSEEPAPTPSPRNSAARSSLATMARRISHSRPTTCSRSKTVSATATSS